jgi:hypothetical protein
MVYWYLIARPCPARQAVELAKAFAEGCTLGRYMIRSSRAVYDPCSWVFSALLLAPTEAPALAVQDLINELPRSQRSLHQPPSTKFNDSHRCLKTVLSPAPLGFDLPPP